MSQLPSHRRIWSHLGKYKYVIFAVIITILIFRACKQESKTSRIMDEYEHYRDSVDNVLASMDAYSDSLTHTAIRWKDSFRTAKEAASKIDTITIVRDSFISDAQNLDTLEKRQYFINRYPDSMGFGDNTIIPIVNWRAGFAIAELNMYDTTLVNLGTLRKKIDKLAEANNAADSALVTQDSLVDNLRRTNTVLSDVKSEQEQVIEDLDKNNRWLKTQRNILGGAALAAIVYAVLKTLF